MNTTNFKKIRELFHNAAYTVRVVREYFEDDDGIEGGKTEEDFYIDLIQIWTEQYSHGELSVAYELIQNQKKIRQKYQHHAWLKKVSEKQAMQEKIRAQIQREQDTLSWVLEDNAKFFANMSLQRVKNNAVDDNKFADES